MLLDPAGVPGPEMYRFLISAVVPRPIAFVSTRGADGVVNLAPFSYFNSISSVPPLVGIAIVDRPGDDKDTLRNVRETGEFVVNLVCEPMLPAMARTAGEWPRGTSEFEVSGLTPSPSERVAPPGVAESPIQLECRLHREIPLGNSILVVGEVVLARVSDEVLTEGRVDPLKLRPVGRLGGEYYSLLREVVKENRPRVSRATGSPLG
ncbi:MAG: flavin reductase family protein [Candidatus Eisenbacteria bacterium]|nr:flavin reductase family protein [Candidatus Eisenbacteria bacterium]